jgi:hypothetical protein
VRFLIGLYLSWLATIYKLAGCWLTASNENSRTFDFSRFESVVSLSVVTNVVTMVSIVTVVTIVVIMVTIVTVWLLC